MGLIKQVLKAYSRANKQRERQKQSAKNKIAIHMSSLNGRLNIISASKSVRSIETQFGLIFALLDNIAEIERQFPGIVSPSSSELRIGMLKTRDIRIRDFALEETNLNIEKSKEASKKTTKINLLEKSIMLLVEARSFIQNPDLDKTIDEKISEVKTALLQVQAGG